MLARCLCASLQGLEARAVVVEVDLAPGLPGVQLVGLPDKAIQESRERVRSALRNSGFRGPLVRVVINLAPADLQLRLERRSAKEMAERRSSPTETSASCCNPARIKRARQRMKKRNPAGASNGRLSAGALRQIGTIEAAGLDLLEQLIEQRGLSTRSSLQLLRVARTIADLSDRTTVDRHAVAEASCYRCTDLIKEPGAQ